MKHHFRNLFVAFVVVCLVAAVLEFLVTNPYSQNFMGMYLNRIISKQTNLSVSFESLNVRFIPLEVDIFGVRILPTEKEDAGASAEATQIKLKPSLPSIMLGKPTLALLHVDGLRLRIPPTFQGKILKTGVGKKVDPSAWHIKNMTLENAQILVDFSSEQRPDSRLNLYGVNVGLTFKSWAMFHGQLNIISANVESKGKELFRGSKVAGKIQLVNENISLTELSIQDRFFKSISNLKGSLELKKGKPRFFRVNGDSEIDVNLQILEHLFAWENTHGRGKIKTKLFLDIPFEKTQTPSFSAKGKVQAKDGYLEDIRIYDSTSNFTADNNGVHLKDAKIVIDQKEYGHVNGFIAFNDKIDFDFKGRVWEFPLSKIVSSFGTNFEDVDFKTYSDNIAFSGTGEPFKMNLNGQAELAQVDFPHIKIERKHYNRIPNCYANLNLFFTNKRLDFKNTDVQCFIPPQGHIPNPPKQRNFTAPASSLFASNLQLREYVDFDEGPHLSLIGTNVDLGLGQTYFQTDLGGKADVVSRIYESKNQLSITNTFSSNNLILMQVPYGEFKGTLEVLDHSLAWKDVTIGGEASQTLSRSGSYDWDKDLLSFQVETQNLPKELVQNTIGLLKKKDLNKLAFSIKKLNGQFQIPLSRIANMQTDFVAELESIEYDEMELSQSLNFSNKTKGGQFHFEDLTAHVGSIELTGDIKYKKKHFDTLFRNDDEIEATISTIKSEDTSKNDFEQISYVSKYLAPFKVFGKVDFEAKFKGQIGKLEGYVNSHLDSLSTNGYYLYPLQLKAFVNHSKFQIFASQPGDNFVGRLDFDLEAKGIPYKVFLNLKQFDLRPFGPYLFSSDARNYAYLTAQWSWAGTFENWWHSKGSVKLEDFNMAFFPISGGKSAVPLYVKSAEPTTILMSEKGWSFENDKTFKLTGSGVELEMRMGNSKPPEKLSIQLASNLDLSILPQLVPYVNSSRGEIYAEASLQGPVDALELKSHVWSNHEEGADPIVVSILDMSPVFQDVRVDLFYTKGRLVIKELSARKGKGTLEVGGVYDLYDKDYPSQINANLDQVSLDINVPYLKNVHTILAGKVVISGSEKPYKIDGNIKILRAQTERFLDIEGEIIREFNAHRIRPSFQDEKNPLFRFNLAIEANKSIDIKSRTFSAVISSNVSLKGTSGRPILLGAVNIDKGKFRYKRDFVISQGEIIFDNPLRSDPKLNIIANAQTGQYTVTIFITGESSKPFIDIVVDPSTKGDGSPISRLDAIILLSTGRLPETDSRSQETTRGVVVSTGLNLYAAQLPFDKFNDLTGQSYISPYVNYTTDDLGNPVPQLNVPLHISETIEALVQSIPGRYSATVQVPLHDSISVSGSAASTQSTTNNIQESSQTHSGFDVQFTFPFK